MHQIDLIRNERVFRNNRTEQEILRMIGNGECAEAAHHFMFYMSAEAWKIQFEGILAITENLYRQDNCIIRGRFLEFLSLLAIGLRSYLPHIRLHDLFSGHEIENAFQKVLDLILELEKLDKDVTEKLCSQFVEMNAKQFEAEGVSSASARSEAEILVGTRLSQYIRRITKKISSSNFYHYSIEQKNSKTKTILGNDYGEFLQYTMWLGYSFQTTNPPLIKMIWDLDREYWSGRLLLTLDEIENNGGKLDLSHTCSLAALIVVEKGCRLLRDWFLTSEGKDGYVCFQVNPLHNGDAKAMVAEAVFVYEILANRLGGVPNVSFKLPGTRAGLIAAGELGEKGYSLTITLNFTAFQAMEFGKVFRQTKALTSYVVVMNGRLAYPVRDELAALEQNIPSTSSWFAGVEVTRHIFQKFYRSPSEGGLGLNPEKIKILNASLRVYGEEIPDISSIWGTSLITIFPNVRRSYDAMKRFDSSDSINCQTDASVMEDLKKSELFRQAWWVPQDDESFKPKTELTLSENDEEAVLDWLPIKQTLQQFISEYHKLMEIVENLAIVK